MYNFTREEFEELRKKHLYRITNGAWNKSGINHPDNIGYLINHIGNLQPESYEEWKGYFYKNIANQNKLLEYAKRFRDFIYEDSFVMSQYNYHYLHIKVFYEMVACRLIYETWLGYSAEVETGKILDCKLKECGFPVKMDKLSPKEDNKYAVDFLLYYKDRLICGVQVKSENYLKSKQKIVQDTIETNKKKNKIFSEVYGVPVQYAYYRRIASAEYKLINNPINDIKLLIQN